MRAANRILSRFDGLILVRGYLNDPAATKKAFNADHYFMTGDLAVVHPDGSVEIQDRGKDIIISGKQFLPSEARG